MENTTILVVEDEKPLAKAIQLKFEKHGFDVVTARTVEQAQEYVHDDIGVSVIWLDHYLLGKETGLDFVAHIKDHDAHRNMPIFVVSNTASPEKRQTYLRLGAHKYYVKADHRLDDIIKDIKEFLETRND